MNKLIASAGVFLITVGIVSAGDLKTYKATYEKELETIILSHGMEMTELGQQYSKSLDTLLTKVKRAGDLVKTTAVMEEVARFGKEKAMPKKPSTLLDIQNLQSSFIKQASTHEAYKAKRIISLTSQYDRVLERLQKSLVSSSKLDDAKAIQEERTTAQESEICQQAKAALVSYAKRPPKPVKTKALKKGLTAEDLHDKEFFFAWKLGRKTGQNGTVLLRGDGKIVGPASPNETTWTLDKEGHLIFKHQDSRVSTTFTKHKSKNGKHFFEGSFHFKKDVIHVLEEK